MGPCRYAFGLAVGGFEPVAVLLVVVSALAAAILILAHRIGPRRHGAIKEDTYESGMEPIGDTRRRFNVRFYLVAVLYLVFAVEIVFLYPWAVLFPRLTAAANAPEPHAARRLLEAGGTPTALLLAAGVFLALLLVGFVYEWRRGVFKWN
jgi:NADH-quinone oxidoreductase subunit A